MYPTLQKESEQYVLKYTQERAKCPPLKRAKFSAGPLIFYKLRETTVHLQGGPKFQIGDPPDFCPQKMPKSILPWEIFGKGKIPNFSRYTILFVLFPEIVEYKVGRVFPEFVPIYYVVYAISRNSGVLSGLGFSHFVPKYYPTL
jgi:hypothetical protein